MRRDDISTPSARHILKGEEGAAGVPIKIALLVASVLVPVILVNTIALKGLYRQLTANIHNQEQLAMVGSGFFSIFITNGFIAIIVASLAVGIVFWALRPGDDLARKVIRTMGKGSPPPKGKNNIQYAIDLLDNIDIE